MRGWDTYLAGSTIAILCLLTFGLGSNELGLSKAALEQGEWVRCFSFIFAHNGASHLLINLVALAFVTLIARELKISGLGTIVTMFSFSGLHVMMLLLSGTNNP